MTIIIVEGPDGAGKSHLVERLVELLTGRYPKCVDVWHRGVPTAHALDEYVRPLLDYRPGGGRHVICDRWHVGEFVYPRVHDRPTTMDPAVWAYVDAFMCARGAVVVYLLPSDDVIAYQLTRRVAGGGDLGDVPPLAPVRAFFEEAHRSSTVQSYRLTAPVTDPATVLAILHLAETVERDATHLADVVTYVGPTHLRRLLVGDVRNGGHSLGHGTAFMPYPATSGHYLFNAVAPLTRSMPFGVINANDVDDLEEFLRSVRTRTHDLDVVALGNRAHGKLRELGVRHGVVPHPQWWRRFLHGFPGEYAMSLVRALQSGEDLRGEHPEGSWLRNARGKSVYRDYDQTDLEMIPS